MDRSPGLLTENPLLASLAPHVLEQLKPQFTLRRFEPDDFVFHQGSKPSGVYVVMKGQLKVCRYTSSGEEVIVQLVGKGDTVLESIALQNHPSSVTLQAQTAAELYFIPLPLVLTLLLENQKFATAYLKLVCSRNDQLTHLLEQVVGHPAEERVAGFLLSSMLDQGVAGTEFTLSHKKNEIARYLGLAPETFSRCLKQLEKKGITVNGRNVTLQTPEDLCNYCDPVQGRRCSNRARLRCRMFGLS